MSGNDREPLEFDEISWKRVLFTKRPFKLAFPVSREVAATLSAEVLNDFLGENICLTIRGFMCTHDIASDVEVHTRESYPTSWWQATKAALFPYGDDWFSAWVLRRWPVRRRQHTFRIELERWAKLPEYTPPSNVGRHFLHDEIRWSESSGDVAPEKHLR